MSNKTEPSPVTLSPEERARNIMDEACLPKWYYDNGVYSACVSAIASALEAERLEERERCKVFNADIIAMILSENPDASPAYLAVQICERIENA